MFLKLSRSSSSSAQPTPSASLCSSAASTVVSSRRPVRRGPSAGRAAASYTLSWYARTFSSVQATVAAKVASTCRSCSLNSVGGASEPQHAERAAGAGERGDEDVVRLPHRRRLRTARRPARRGACGGAAAPASPSRIGDQGRLARAEQQNELGAVDGEQGSCPVEDLGEDAGLVEAVEGPARDFQPAERVGLGRAVREVPVHVEGAGQDRRGQQQGGTAPLPGREDQQREPDAESCRSDQRGELRRQYLAEAPPGREGDGSLQRDSADARRRPGLRAPARATWPACEIGARSADDEPGRASWQAVLEATLKLPCMQLALASDLHGDQAWQTRDEDEPGLRAAAPVPSRTAASTQSTRILRATESHREAAPVTGDDEQYRGREEFDRRASAAARAPWRPARLAAAQYTASSSSPQALGCTGFRSRHAEVIGPASDLTECAEWTTLNYSGLRNFRGMLQFRYRQCPKRLRTVPVR